MLLFVPPEQQSKVRESLKNLIYVPFRFEFAGSQIIFFDPQEEYFSEELARASRDGYGSTGGMRVNDSRQVGVGKN